MISARPTKWQWQDSAVIVEGKEARPYIKYHHEVVEDGQDRIHMAFTDGHPRDVPTNAIYYACLENGHLKRGTICYFMLLKVEK